MFTIVYWISCNFIIVLYIRLEFFRCNVFFTRQNEHAQKTGCVSEVMYTQLCANRYQVCCNLSRAERNFHFFFGWGGGGGWGGWKMYYPIVWKQIGMYENVWNYSGTVLQLHIANFTIANLQSVVVQDWNQM